MAANWLIIAGFVLLILGFALRIVMMMRSSDATPAGARVLHGRELLRQYRTEFPRSVAPLLTRSTLICGTALLLAGLAIEFSH
jgi:preprotein translocase subunit SecG